MNAKVGQAMAAEAHVIEDTIELSSSKDSC